MRRVRYSGSVRAILLDRENILERLRSLSAKLKAELPYVREVRLFGSLARGEEHGLSDVDLLVVVDRLNREIFWSVYGEIFEIVSEALPVDFDLVVMSEEEFLSDPNRFGPTLPVS